MKKYWLALNRIDKLGPVSLKKLYEHFGSAEKIWTAPAAELQRVEGVRREAVNSLITSREKIDPDAELGGLGDIQAVCLDEPAYPASLKNIYDPPPVLYIKGQLRPADSKAIAIVGTRRASRYGLEVAEKFAAELAALGFTIVSGLALGIDTAAHHGALRAKGRTVAVLGTGVDVIYPPQNRRLAGEIEQSGAVVSEFPLGNKPEPGSFPRRNRIISGLALGVIMVEGHYDSGAMITAKLALDQGREVFAVPSNIALEQSKGPHWLIKQGAKLVEGVDDVLEELNIQPQTSNLKHQNNDQIPTNNLNEEEKKIIGVLSAEPMHLDAIAIAAGLPVHQASSLLMVLELNRAVRQLPGKNFVLG